MTLSQAGGYRRVFGVSRPIFILLNLSVGAMWSGMIIALVPKYLWFIGMMFFGMALLLSLCVFILEQFGRWQPHWFTRYTTVEQMQRERWTLFVGRGGPLQGIAGLLVLAAAV